MAQQVFPQWSPVVKAHNEDQQEVYIPAAIIHAQTRDGKDELIVGAANMQFDPETGDYLPTHAGNPVEVRARALETLLQTLGKEETLALVKAALDVLVSKDFATQTTLAAVLEKLADLATESTLDGVKSAVDALASTVDAGAQKVTLTGQIPSGSNTIGRVAIDRDESSPVVTHPRQILTSSVFNLIPVPAGAVGVKVETVIHGVTGTFSSGQGVRTDVWGYGQRLGTSVIQVNTQRTQQSGRSHFIWWYPGIDEEINFDIRPGNELLIVNSVLPPRMNFRIDITGTFEDGQGVDCEQFIWWLF